MNITIENNKDYKQYITMDDGAKYNNLITMNDIRSWKKDKVQFLNGGTGTGKSYFILHNLTIFARENDYKILYLCNRKKLRVQMENDTNNTNNSDIITVISYQKLQNMINDNECIEKYDIIVADECHYFISDASFNITTDLSYKWILNQTNAIKILMSATCDDILRQIKKDIEIENMYTIIKNYNYVEKVVMLCGDNNMKDLIENLMIETPKDEKIIYFCRKSDTAFELYNKYKENACFYVSESNKYSKYNTYTDVETKDIFIRSNTKDDKQLITFPKKLLITTCVLDNGVNIIDRNVKHLITDLIDLDKLIQCVGRKRVIDKEDTCKFYIKNWSKQELSRVKNGLMRDIQPAMDFYKDEEEFKNKYLDTIENERMFKNKFIYTTKDGVMKLKEMQYNKQLDDIIQISIMMMDKCNFKSCLYAKMSAGSEQIKSDLYYITTQWDFIKDKENNKLENYLESIVGKKLYKEEKKELKDVFENNGLKARTLGINTLNGWLKDNEMPYIIDNPEPKPYRDENGKLKRDKTYWIVGKIVY